MAGVAKWLRQRVVVPPFAGSSPVIRPIKIINLQNLEKLKSLKQFYVTIPWT